MLDHELHKIQVNIFFSYYKSIGMIKLFGFGFLCRDGWKIDVDRIKEMSDIFDLEVAEIHDGSPSELRSRIRKLDNLGAEYKYLMLVLMGHGGMYRGGTSQKFHFKLDI